MNIKELSSEGKIAYLIKPILKVLQEAGGQLERSEIKERIADLDDQIAEYAEMVKKSKNSSLVPPQQFLVIGSCPSKVSGSFQISQY